MLGDAGLRAERAGAPDAEAEAGLPCLELAGVAAVVVWAAEATSVAPKWPDMPTRS